MKTKFLYPVLCLLLFACGEDDGTTAPPVDPVEPEAACYVQQAVTTADGVSTTEKYTYDDSNRLTKTERYEGDKLLGTTEHTYDGQGRLQRERLLNAAGEETGSITYLFNNRNQVVRYTTYTPWLDGIMVPQSTVTSSYDSVTVLRSTAAWRFVNNQPVQQGGTSYTYRSNRVMNTATVKNQAGTITDKIVLTFDDKKHPMFGVQKFMMTKYTTPGYPFNNNITGYTVRDATDKDKAAASYTSTYTYNSQGYPVSATITYGDKKVKKIAYTYSCP